MTGGRVWYTSDLHFGHRRVAEARGFGDEYQHDMALVEHWNGLVGKLDTVWVLGDVCLSPRHVSMVAMLNGTKHLILGNHDKPFPGNRAAHKYQAEWMRYFASIQAFARRRVDGIEFLLSHFPYAHDRGDVIRFSQYRLRDEGLPLVHGHTHSSLIYQREYPKQIHVGLDAWNLNPVPQEAVVQLLREVGA